MQNLYFELARGIAAAVFWGVIAWVVLGLIIDLNKWLKETTRLTEARTLATRIDCGAARLVSLPEKPSLVIILRRDEVESGVDRLKMAAALIEQLPESHGGRNDWLLKYRGSNDMASDVWRINAGLGPYGRHLDAS